MSDTPIVRLQSSVGFSAAHRLYSPSLSERANERLFGSCIRTHGHNYRIIVTLRGTIDPMTGYLFSIEKLDEHLREVAGKLDHQDITEAIGPGITATVEHLSVYFWEQLLRSGIPKDILFEVRVQESEKINACFRGEYQ
ncbi:hypothetical protein ACOME3_008403 [Neoechinorhynchus agilis]